MNLENNVTPSFYRSIIAAMPMGIVVADKEGRFVLANKQASPIFNKELFERKPEEWIDTFGVYRIDKKTKFKLEDLPMYKALEKAYTNNEKMFVKHEGIPEGVFLKVSGFPVFDKQSNEFIGGAIIFEDITKEQKLYDNVIGKINELEEYLKDLITINEILQNEYNKNTN